MSKRPNLKVVTTAVAEPQIAEEQRRRSELASAIANSQKAAKRLDANREAAERALQLIEEAETELDQAKLAVSKAQDRLARRTERSAVVGGAPADSGELREARARETDASDRASAARTAAANIDARMPVLEEARRDAEAEISAAANRLLALPSTGLLERAQSLQAELGAVRAVLRFVKRGLAEADKKAVNAFFEAPPLPHEQNQYGTPPALHPILSEWEAFGYAVTIDPETPLPKVP